MQYIRGIENYENANRTAITLGKFDGLHLGHQMLIEKVMSYQMTEDVDSVVFAFDMRPLYQKMQKEYQGLMSHTERIHSLDDKVDYLVECPFEPHISNMDAKTFIEEVLVKKFHAKYIVVGTDFRFGYHRQGNCHMLETFAKKYDFHVDVIEKKCYGEREISSTYIKEELVKGEIAFANTLLGYPYTFSGEIVHGRKLGRTIGIPTMNLLVDGEKVLPPNGVYLCDCTIDHQIFHGICNLGRKPTVVEQGETLLEVHALDYQGDAYGKNVDVHLLDRVREEKKFASVEELKSVMEADIKYSKKYFDII